MRLKDKVAVLTGGAGGIGREVCELFAAEGAKLMIADIDYDGAAKLAEDLNRRGYKANAIDTNVREFEGAKQLVNETLASFGQVDILANIAGGSAGVFLKNKHAIFSESTLERWQEVIDVNLYSALNCSRAVVNHMIERRSGKIISLASTAGMVGMQKAAEYSAAKAGIIGFTKSLAKELGPYGINVNCVAPGIIGTERVRQMPKEMVAGWQKGIPLGRLGDPKEVAYVILFLASDESSYLTGINIPVEGGMRLGPITY